MFYELCKTLFFSLKSFLNPLMFSKALYTLTSDFCLFWYLCCQKFVICYHYIVINVMPNWCWANIFLNIYFQKYSFGLCSSFISLVSPKISKRIFRTASNWVFRSQWFQIDFSIIIYLMVASNLCLIILFSGLSSVLLKLNGS